MNQRQAFLNPTITPHETKQYKSACFVQFLKAYTEIESKSSMIYN